MVGITFPCIRGKPDIENLLVLLGICILIVQHLYYSFKKSDICAQGKSIKAVIINIQYIVVWLDSIILKINREMPTKLSTRVGLWSIFSFIFIHARMGIVAQLLTRRVVKGSNPTSCQILYKYMNKTQGEERLGRGRQR